jgi:hypothetical protein
MPRYLLVREEESLILSEISLFQLYAAIASPEIIF